MAWRVSGFPFALQATEDTSPVRVRSGGLLLAAVFQGYFTPGSELRQPGLRSGHPSSLRQGFDRQAGPTQWLLFQWYPLESI
jgi:hypothetical protein